ncbi:G8 domain-containing protein [Deinococcus multiflagellatus]|uniref:G8 domain-containing protein n=1 Tax=Deinococcus multiflagellatus TaxID=1656887 RepID=UPI001CCDB38E|nr:G8 domain-containing protein [Deinococcus multiflagellatus]MBZ9712314.1 G8 domain-containing protein [Deinococcus multiflagellatus]
MFKARWPLALTLSALLIGCGASTGDSGATPTPPPGTPAPTPQPPAPTPPAPTPSQPGSAWSDPATWGGTVPAAGANVTLPAGKRVILDVSPPALTGLTIPAGSALEFAAKNLTLQSEWIMVHGELRIGREEAPFAHHAEIRLTNTVPGEDVMGMGDRVLGVMDGTLELHGQPRLAWTRLSATARAGSSTLTLERAPDWKGGDTLTLTSTDFNPAQTEQVTVQRVSGNTVTLGSPLKYTHWGDPITVSGRAVNERAEVGLLSRNIVVGATEDAVQSRVGAHVMIMGKSTARIEGTEFTRVGQLNTLRRYPVHFHLLGSAAASYLRSSSVHASFNRCVVVHGTSDLRVLNNVTYDTLGHCIFLEDGDETGNVLQGNLVTRVKAPDSKQGQNPLLDSDKRPSGYWITNPANTVKDNVAAGVDGTGFWYAMPQHPTGLASGKTTVWPRRTPLGEFSGNVAHSGDRGLNVDNGPKADGSLTETVYYDPVTNPADPKSAAVPAVFSDFVAYKHRDHGVWLRGENHVLQGAVLADNAVGATFASHLSVLKGGLLVGETVNVGQPESWEAKGEGGRSLPRPWEAAFPIRGYQFYDGQVSIQDAALAAFVPNSIRKASGLGYLTKNAFPLNPANHARGLTWLDSSVRVYLPDPQADKDGDKAATFMDTDGTVTGAAGLSVTGSPLLRAAPDCQGRAEWNASVCTGSYGRLWLQDVRGGQPGPVTVAGPHGTVSLKGTPDAYATVSTTARVGHAYTLTPTNTTAQWRLGLSGRQPGDTLRLTLPATSEPILYRDWWIDNRNRLKKVALGSLDATTGDSYAYEGGQLHLKLVVQPGRDYAVLDVCTADLCK